MYGKHLWRVGNFLANGISLRLGEAEMKKIVASSTVQPLAAWPSECVPTWRPHTKLYKFV